MSYRPILNADSAGMPINLSTSASRLVRDSVYQLVLVFRGTVGVGVYA